MGFLFEVVFYQPIYNLLMLFYNLSGHNLGIAILLIALVVKLITIPMTRKQMESGKKMKIFQEKSKQIKEKFAKNKEKMNEELMKLTQQYMPAQLSGCLPLIISIIFLIQVRNVVVHLVNQGYESFNNVAYAESMKFDVDSATFKPENSLKEGKNDVAFVIEASNDRKYEESIIFFREEDEKKGKQAAKDYDKALTNEQKAANEKVYEENRKSDISIHISNFDNGRYVTEEKPEFKVFFRPPSNEEITKVEIKLNGEDITDKSEITKGEKINLNFLGMNLSKVGTDFVGDWKTFIPYLFLALFIGITQFLTTKLQMGLNPQTKPSATPKNASTSSAQGKKDKESEPDFSEIMQQSSQQMIYMMPLMTSGIALGFLGGAQFFPSAVSLFWTANNLFVIIQQVYNGRKDLKKMFEEGKINGLKKLLA